MTPPMSQGRQASFIHHPGFPSSLSRYCFPLHLQFPDLSRTYGESSEFLITTVGWQSLLAAFATVAFQTIGN
jgi:hypothetical protein